MLLLYILVFAKLQLRCTLYLWTRASTSESRGVFGCHSGENYVKWSVDEPSNKNNASDQRVDTVRCDIGPERRRYSARVFPPGRKLGKLVQGEIFLGSSGPSSVFLRVTLLLSPGPRKNDASPYILPFFLSSVEKELGEHAGDHVATAEHDVA